MYFPPPPNSLPVKQTKPNAQRRPSAFQKQQFFTTRRVFTFSILISSFVILILAIIFASCVAIPHSDASSLTNMSVTARRDIPGDPATDGYNTAVATDQSKQTLYSKPSNLAALGFYSITLPFLTMTHSALELAVLCIRRETSSSSAGGRSRLRRILPILSLSACIVLILGWIPMNLIWMNCEIAGAQIIAVEKICPVQTRGHNMGGINEVSLTKVIFAWIVVGLYISYAAYGYVFKIHTGKRSNSGRRARFASAEDVTDHYVSKPDEFLAKEVR